MPGSSTATGADDATQAAAGATGTATVKTSAADSWVAQTVALKQSTAAASIAVQTPAGYAANSGFVLVTIAVSNLGNGAICAPNGGWTPVMAAKSVGTSPAQVTQESFYTSTANAGSYTFSFKSGGCNGSAVSAGASSVAVNYTGVDLTNPFDGVAPQQASGPPPNGPAPTAVTTNSIDDTVVSLFATDAPSLTVPNGGVVQNSAAREHRYHGPGEAAAGAP